MKIIIDRSFEKDTNRIKDKFLLEKIADCIENIQNADNMQALHNLKKLKGGTIYYRIRIGDYRIGAIVKSNTIIFIRFLHRKAIYNYFP